MLKIMDAARGGLITGVMLILAGCSQVITPTTQDGTMPSPSVTAPAAETLTTPTVTPPGGARQMTPPLPTTPSAGLQSLIDKAKEDLSRRLNFSISQISLVEAKAVTWPDASLGCPQEGMVYAQVLTPGYLILLSAAGKEYEYHASRGTEIVYCVNPSPPVPGTPADT